jgi:glyoxylase-like metal-dependent hydrolase (beta-lactamase superfamily II)
MRLGEFDLYSLHENTFWIDGGAMFGVIPRVLWKTLTPPDDQNRVELRANLLLVRTGQKNILVETGLGDAIPAKWKANYGVKEPSGAMAQLRQLGLGPDDIDVLILTHLHFDHSGGCVRRQDGAFVPTFPGAQHVIQEREWQDALNPDARSRASYFKEMLLPLSEQGLLRLVDGSTQIAPGIQVVSTGGHTRGHQVVLISSAGKTALFCGDLIPTTSHLRTAYVAGVDLFPLETMKKKKEMIRQAVEEGWLVFFGDDTLVYAGYLSRGEKGRIQLEPCSTVPPL